MTFDRSDAFAAEVMDMLADVIRACGDMREAREQVAHRHREDMAEIKLAAAGERTEGLD